MIIKSIDLQIAHHRKLLDARAQDRLVQSEEFIELWETGDKKKILFLLRKIKPNKIRELIKTKTDLSIAELRHLASYYRISNYSRKTRVQLLTEIENAKTTRRTK